MITDVQSLDELEEEAFQELDNCGSLEELDDFHIEYLGRDGKISRIFDSMDSVPDEKRAEIGRRANELKNTLSERYESLKEQLAGEDSTTSEDWIDVTLSGRNRDAGSVHPIATVLREIEDIFRKMGFRSEDGPEIETEWYNFEALNIPEDHPARDMHDTFYLEDNRLLRTHTSPVQIRTMEDNKPPVRIIVPGRVFRRDADRTHSPVFHQVEGLWVDDSVTFTELKGTLELFVERFFDEPVETRFRPSYFPFTEPSAEIDISFQGSGSSEWLEILGAGMVDPAVFDAVGYDPESVQGFAFGMGVERLAMLKYDIDNLQLLFENDLRFLEQFSNDRPIS
ncbi:MAG: phenylalanine--tRNA ligase subunit alpha [bacterium]